MTSLDETVAAGTALLRYADAGELLTLQLAAWVREAMSNDTLEIPPLKEGLEDVRAQLADPTQTVWGYRRDGRLIATVRTSMIDESTAYLGRLGVVPDQLRQGLGGALLRLAESRLPSTVSRIELVTGIRSFDNHRFYAAHGYRITGEDPVIGIARMAKDR